MLMSLIKFKRTRLHVEMNEKNCDETDKPPHSNHVTYLNLGSLFFSIILHFLDVGFDLYVAYSYFVTEKYSYFACTAAFIALSSIILSIISIRMYVEDSNGRAFSNKHAVVRIVLCVSGTIFQLALPIRYFDALQYAIKSLKAEYKTSKKQQEKYFLKMLNEDSDVALLRVFECYLESAPQQVLQIALLLVDYIEGSNEHTTKQIILITLGFVSMGWCMANYHRCIRIDQEKKKNISVLGITVQFFWHLNFTVSRILAISALATLYTFWTCTAVVTHWCAMTIWVSVSSNANFCGKNKIFEIFFNSAAGMVYIFNLLNMKEGSTKNSYLFFYLLCFLENIIAAAIWGVKSTVIKNWIYYIFTVFPIFCFALSVGFLILYYQYLHPNKFKSSIEHDENILFKDYKQGNAHDQRITFSSEQNN